MDVQRNAVLEISRLRLYQSTVEKCKRWACGSSVIFISLYFAPTSVMYDAHKAVLQIVILLTALCSVGFIYFFGKPTTALTRKQMKLLGVSEDDITYLAVPATPTPPVANASRPPAVTQSTSTSNYDSSSRPSTSQGGTPSSSSRTYRIPNGVPQSDHRNFDITNADKTAGTCWLDISKDTQNNSNNSQNRPMRSSPQMSGGIMGSQNSGGSYRGFGSSPSGIYGSGSGIYGSGSKVFNGDYSNVENSPFASSFSFSQEKRSFKTFKSYNVSPMMDATSPGFFPSLLGSRGNSASKVSGGLKLKPTNALSSLGIKEIADSWINNCKQLLNSHTQKSLLRHECAVSSILAVMKERGLGDHLVAAKKLLEFRTEKESFGAGSVMTRIDLLTHIKTSMSPQLVSELQAIETIFLVLTRTTSFSGSSSSSISSPLGGSSFSAPVSVPFGRIQAAYQRAGELNLSYDKAHRISRGGGYGSSSSFSTSRSEAPSMSGDNSLSDSDFVMSIFMNYCDFQDRGSDSNHKFSDIHFATAIAEVAELGTAHSNCVGIIRQESQQTTQSPGGMFSSGYGSGVKNIMSPGVQSMAAGNNPHFNVFCADSRCADILVVEDGRQNCYMAIIVFLLMYVKNATESSLSHSRTVGGHGAYVSPVIRALCLEVFQMRDMNSLLDYLDTLGMDCGADDFDDRYSQ